VCATVDSQCLEYLGYITLIDAYFPALLNSNLYVEGSPTMKNQDSDLGKDFVGLKRSRSEGSILDPSDVAQCKFL
jgi:hypothetical protein